MSVYKCLRKFGLDPADQDTFNKIYAGGKGNPDKAIKAVIKQINADYLEVKSVVRAAAKEEEFKGLKLPPLIPKTSTNKSKKEKTEPVETDEDIELRMEDRKVQQAKEEAQQAMEEVGNLATPSNWTKAKKAAIKAADVEDKAEIKKRKINEKKLQRKKENFLDNPYPRSFKGVKFDELKVIAESLGVMPEPATGKKRVTISQLKEAINGSEEVTAAREEPKKELVGGKKRELTSEEVKDAEQDKAVEEAMTPTTVELTAEEIAAEKEAEKKAKEEAERIKKLEEEAAKAQKAAEEAEAIKAELAKAQDEFAGWTEEDGTFFDEEGEIFEPSKRKRARYYAAVGKTDPEALVTEGKDADVVSPKYSKALKEFNKAKSQYENGTITQEDLAKAEVKFNKVKKDVEAEGVEAAKGDTVKVQKEMEAPTVKEAESGVAGQEEVDVTGETTLNDVVDTELTTDIEEAPVEAKEAMTPEEKLAAAITRVVEKATPKKKNISLERFRKLDDQTREDIEFGEHPTWEVTDAVVQQYEKEQEDNGLDYEAVQLYRGIKAGKQRRKYPGRYYTELPELARQYADTTTANGTVQELGFTPKNVFDVDAIQGLSDSDKQAMLDDVIKYMEERGIDPEDSYIYDVLNGETDFAYPIQADSDFLLDNGFDSVRYEKEGGDTVKSWFIPVRETDTDLTSEPTVKTYDTTVDDVKAEIRKNWGVDTFDNMYVVDSIDAIPDRFKGKVRGTARAFHDPSTGQIILIADRITADEVRGIVLHELGVHKDLANSEEWADTLASFKKLYDNGDTVAQDAYNKAWERNQDKSQEKIWEEAIAYVVQDAPASTFTKRIIRNLKKLFRKLTGADLTTEDIVDIVRAKVAERAIQEQGGTATSPKTGYEGTEVGQLDYTEVDPDLQKNVEESEDPKFTSDLYTQPESNSVKQTDKVNNMAKDLWHLAKTKGLTFIPSRPLMGMLDRILPNGIKISDIQDMEDTAEAKANARIDKIDKELLKPLQRYRKDNLQEYEQMVDMAIKGSLKGKNMKDSTEYEVLSPEGKKMYDQIIQHYRDMGDDRIRSLESYVKSLNINEDKQAEMLNEIEEMDRQMKKNKGYIPFNRFGVYKVEAILSDGTRYVSHHDKYREAKLAKEKIIKDGGKASLHKVTSQSEAAQELMTKEAYDRAKSFIEEAGGDQAAQEALWETFLHFSPHKALQRRLARRKSISGMSADMVRMVGQSTHSTIREMEKLKIKGYVQQKFAEVAKAIREMKGDTVEQEELLEEIKLRQATTHRDQWSKNLTKGNFFYYLGFNPASALINLTQNAIVAMPILAAEHGTRRSIVEMNKAFFHITKNMHKKEKQWGLEGAEQKAMKRLAAEGAVSVSLAHQMTGIKEGFDVNFDPDNKIDEFIKASSWMFHNAEIVNRATTALAAFRMKYDPKKGNFEEAVKYSKDKVFESQFDFSEAGKSRAQRSNFGNVFLAMRSYPINMAVYMGQNVNRWLLDSTATPEEKRQARVKLLGTMVATASIGGASALPLFTFLPEFFLTLFGDDEEDPAEVVREGVYAIAGEDIGDVILNGLLGKATGLDLTSKVSIGLDLLVRMQTGTSASETLDTMAENLFGAVGGIPASLARGADQINQGKYAVGLTTMLPAALRNVLTAANAGAEGVRYTSNDTYVEAFGMKDAIAKALGFNSDEYREYFQQYSSERREEKAIKAAKKRFRREYALAVIQGDLEERRRVRQAIRVWNRGRPHEQKLLQSSLSSAVKRMKEQRTAPKE